MSAVEPILAGVVFKTGDPIDALLSQCVRALQEDKTIALAGVAQVKQHDPVTGKEKLCLSSLAGEWVLPILEDRGKEAQGCRLDSSAIVEVAARLDDAFVGHIDLLVINRFGRAESEGHGLRSVMERAALLGIPVLVGVRDDYSPAWQAFHSGLGTELRPDLQAILEWWRCVRGR